MSWPSVTTTRTAASAGSSSLEERLGDVIDLDAVVGPQQPGRGDDEPDSLGERAVGEHDGLEGDQPCRRD